MKTIIRTLLVIAVLGLAARAGKAADPEGTIVLRGSAATLSGWAAGSSVLTNHYVISFWTGTNKTVKWPVSVPARRTYRLFLQLACDSSEAGSQFEVRVAGQVVNGTVPGTGGWSKYEQLDMGPVMIRKPGDYDLEIQAVKLTRGGLMNLKSVKLVPE